MATIAGVQKQVDTDTQNVIGQLLVNEEDEAVNANDETWKILYALIGGAQFIVIFLSFNAGRRYFWHTGVIARNWLFSKPESEQ